MFAGTTLTIYFWDDFEELAIAFRPAVLVFSGGAEVGYESIPQGGYEVDVPSVPSWITTNDWNHVIDAGESIVLSAGLTLRQEPVLNAYGNHAYIEHVNPEDDKIVELEYLYNQIQHTEIIKSYTWASDNLSVLKVSPVENGATCRINAVGTGTSIVSVTIETEQGNSYAAEFQITVREVEINGKKELNLGDSEELTATPPITFADENIIVEYTWMLGGDSVSFDLTDAPEGTVAGKGQTCKIKASSRGVAEVSLLVEYKKLVSETEVEGEDGQKEIVKEYETFCKFTNSVDVYVGMRKANGATLSASANTVEVDSTVSLTVELYPGSIHYEDIVSCTWSADTEGIVHLEEYSFFGNEGCNVTGVAEGRVTVSVTVRTERGQEFVKDIIITVTAPAEPEATENTETEPTT